MSSSTKKAAKEAFDIHPILDAVGFVPVLGEPADFVNGLIYASEEDYINAGLSMAAVIPVIGEAGKMTKYGAKAIEKSKGLKKIGKTVTKPLSKKSSKTYQAGKKSLKKTDTVGNMGKNGKKTVKVNGKTVIMDNSIFDPNFVDGQGRTNIQRMEQGLAPIGTDGKSTNIHHIDQTNNRPVAEIAATEHQQNYINLHSNTGKFASQINRAEFSSWRRRYWEWRSKHLQ